MPSPLFFLGGGGKQKIGDGDGRNSRPKSNCSPCNQVPPPPSPPHSKEEKLILFCDLRSFGAHFLANAQASAGKNIIKVAHGVTKKPKVVIVDIDAEDAHNELAAVKYVEDMYNYYELTKLQDRIWIIKFRVK